MSWADGTLIATVVLIVALVFTVASIDHNKAVAARCKDIKEWYDKTGQLSRQDYNYVARGKCDDK